MAVITAEFRTELLESLPWFHSTESGLQNDQKRIEGLFLGKHGSKRDYLEGRVAILRLHRVQKANQEGRFKQVVEWAGNSIAQSLPVALVADKANPTYEKSQVKFTEKHCLVLMGQWQLVEAYVEWIDDQKELLGKFLKINDEGIWWQDPQSTLHQSNTAPATRLCDTCDQSSAVRYQDATAWWCGNTSCSLNDTMPDLPTCSYDYTPEYLSQPTAATVSLPAPPQGYPEYLPATPKAMDFDEMTAMVKQNKKKARPFWDGWLCETCHKLNQRFLWSRLECTGCHNIVAISPCPMPYAEVLAGNLSEDGVIKAIRINNKQAVTEVRLETDIYSVHKFVLHAECEVLLCIPKDTAFANQRGPEQWHDELERCTRDGSMHLERFKFGRKQKASQDGQRTRFFGANYGAHYASNMVYDSTPFKQGPGVISKILDHLKSTVGIFYGDAPADFNELLFLAYLPGMSMGWHSDSEESLEGDYVASYSTGASATMMFGLKQEYYTGKTKADKALPDQEICRGSVAEQERVDLQDRYEKGEFTKEEYEREVKTLLEGPKGKKWPENPVRHLEFLIPGTGAIVIQKGEVNKYYEHTVATHGLRYVSTARKMKEDAAATAGQGQGDDGQDEVMEDAGDDEEGKE